MSPVDPTATKASSTTDEANLTYDQTIDPKAERALLWKIDLLLMPILTISLGIQYWDKAVLGSASIFGIIKDLGLSTTNAAGVVSTLRYSTASSAFYWGYIISVLPFSFILQRYPLAKTLSLCIFLWGVTVILTVVCKNYEGLVVQRVFLGVLESSVSPGFVMVTSQWYKKSEIANRLGIWYSATGIFSMISGIVNFGLAKGAKFIAPWKAMYLFAGAFTIVWAGVVLYFIPDSPKESHRWFNEEERRLLALRARQQMVGSTNRTAFNWAHAKEAVFDPKIWLYFLMGSSIYVCNGGVTAFGARIVSSFGYSSFVTILILIPGGLFTCVTIYLFTYLSGKWKNSTTYLIPISCIPVLVGSLIIWQASWLHRGVPLFGYYLLTTFGAPYVLVLASAAVNVAGSTKKSIVSGAIFVGYNVGNIIGPYLVFTPERPIKYRSTWIALIICMVVTSIFSISLRFYLQRENARRDSVRGHESKEAINIQEKQEAEDLTDGANAEFRYSL